MPHGKTAPAFDITETCCLGFEPAWTKSDASGPAFMLSTNFSSNRIGRLDALEVGR
jgi:hypothetical protein